jgi:phosphoglycolate phosphatase
VTDLDNTLWDWFELWHSAFRPFLDELVRVTGLPEDGLKAEIKAVYQLHRTAEYSHVLQELPSLQRKFGSGFDPYQVLPSVIGAYRQGRASSRGVYPGVLETLSSIRAAKALVVGFTESQMFYTTQRVRVFGFDGLIDYLYTTEDRGLPSLEEMHRLRRRPDDYYQLKSTQVRILPTNAKKPDVSLLVSILHDIHCPKEKAVYVGDNLHKDVLMAKDAGVLATHASYGEAHEDRRYQLLVDVTFWKPDDVRLQAQLKAEDDKPDLRLESFPQLLESLEFVPYYPDDSYDFSDRSTTTSGAPDTRSPSAGPH